jgi:ADP-ribose 1''-phosphate phosphatase
MSKQTRLSFTKWSATASKRRRPDSDDKTNEQNERAPQRLKTTGSSKTPLNQTKEQVPSTKTPGRSITNDPSTIESTSPSTVTPSKSTPHLSLTYEKASLFDSPHSTVLCHACNAQGSWGAGIAAAFKKNYPAAFKIYAAHCAKWNGTSLLGSTLLIPPQKKSALKSEREAEHWIACLFTSEKKGKGKGSKESILAATGEAIEDLVRKVKAVNETADEADGKSKPESSKEDRIVAVRMCKINSGLFGVPWEATSEVIEAIEIGEGDIEEIAVFSMD